MTSACSWYRIGLHLFFALGRIERASVGADIQSRSIMIPGKFERESCAEEGKAAPSEGLD